LEAFAAAGNYVKAENYKVEIKIGNIQFGEKIEVTYLLYRYL